MVRHSFAEAVTADTGFGSKYGEAADAVPVVVGVMQGYVIGHRHPFIVIRLHPIVECQDTKEGIPAVTRLCDDDSLLPGHTISKQGNGCLR